MEDVHIAADAAALARAAAEEFARLARAAITARGAFTVALSGGTTPRAVYTLLASDAILCAAIPWQHVAVFWGDERTVPPDHPESNYRMASETLLMKVPVAEANVHRIPAELSDPAAAASRYEAELRSAFGLTGGDLPRFDLVLLGLGADGHTASLFPGTDALHERQRLVVANRVEKLHTWRITLTFPAINSAATVLFLVSGAEKSRPLRDVLEGVRNPERLPAQCIRPTNGRLLWFVDRPAAQLLGAEN